MSDTDDEIRARLQRMVALQRTQAIMREMEG